MTEKPAAAPPDQLDLEELERFERSHVGQVWRDKLLEMSQRHVRKCQDRRASLDDIRASQGALEMVYAVMALAGTIRAEIAKREKKQ